MQALSFDIPVNLRIILTRAAVLVPSRYNPSRPAVLRLATKMKCICVASFSDTLPPVRFARANSYLLVCFILLLGRAAYSNDFSLGYKSGR